jgi:NADH-quinone oxidoreductase subunit C
MVDRSFDDALSGLSTGAAPDSNAGTPQGQPADAASHASVAALRSRFGDAVLHHTVMSRDEHVVYIAPERIREVLQWLHDDADQAYDLLLDLTAVDYGGGRPLEVVYQLWSIPRSRALRLKVVLPLNALEVDSVEPIWKTADWLERETYDMFGIHFRGHPDLRRILMPNNYAEGHPLRKDFPLRGRFSRAEQTRRALSMEVEDFYTPDELRTGKVPPAPGVTKDAQTQPAAPVPAETALPERPNDPDWTLGASGSAASGAPAPEGAGS